MMHQEGKCFSNGVILQERKVQMGRGQKFGTWSHKWRQKGFCCLQCGIQCGTDCGDYGTHCGSQGSSHCGVV